MKSSTRDKLRPASKPPSLLLQQEPKPRLQIQTSSFSGPLPPPAIAEGWTALVPDAAERILKMAEKEQEHRHNMDTTVVRHQIFHSYIGQVSMAAFLLAALVGGFILAWNGSTSLGLASIIVAIVGGAGFSKLQELLSSRQNGVTED